MFFGRLTQVALGQDLVVLGDFNYPVICWKSNIAGHRSSNKFSEGDGGNLLVQKIGKYTVWLPFTGSLQNNEELVADLKVERPWLRQAQSDRKILKRVGIQFNKFHSASTYPTQSTMLGIAGGNSLRKKRISR